MPTSGSPTQSNVLGVRDRGVSGHSESIVAAHMPTSGASLQSNIPGGRGRVVSVHSQSIFPAHVPTFGSPLQSNFSGGRGRGASVHSQSIAGAWATDVPASLSSAAGLPEDNRTGLLGPLDSPSSTAAGYVSRGRGVQPPNQ